MNEITPAGVAVIFGRWFWVAAGALAIIAAVVLGGWAAGWWLTTQDVRNQSNIIRLNYATQESYLSQLSGYISQIDGITIQERGYAGDPAEVVKLKAQALGIGNQACQLLPQISIPLGSDAGWAAANCSAGAVSLTSPLRR